MYTASLDFHVEMTEEAISVCMAHGVLQWTALGCRSLDVSGGLKATLGFVYQIYTILYDLYCLYKYHLLLGLSAGSHSPAMGSIRKTPALRL